MKRKLVFLLFVATLLLSLACSAFAVSEADIYDEADLLTPAEEMQLAEELAQLRQQLDAQIAVVTVSSVDGTIDAYVHEVYDSLAMGCGQNRDGVLLLVCMQIREYRILSNGYAAQAIDPDTIDLIGDALVFDLTEGYYADAFHIFAEECAYYLGGYRNGFPFDAGTNLLIAVVIGLVVGLVVVLVLKGQLKSVRQQKKANAYIKPGSMQLTVSRDLFLYRQISRTKKATNSSSSSSRSGSSRSVGGGSF